VANPQQQCAPATLAHLRLIFCLRIRSPGVSTWYALPLIVHDRPRKSARGRKVFRGWELGGRGGVGYTQVRGTSTARRSRDQALCLLCLSAWHAGMQRVLRSYSFARASCAWPV